MTKTITLDAEAYRILKSHKLKGESFSDVIKKFMAEALLGKELDKVLSQRITALKDLEKANGTPR